MAALRFCIATLLLCLVQLLHCSFGSQALIQPRNVTYDGRALVIDGQRRLLISASIHYPRSTPEMWPDLISKAKDGGVDVIESYVFWDMHEPQQGTYDFDGRLDVIRFIKEAQKAGLFFHLRIGPYACAEWNYGGFPVWLHFLPGIKFRTDNAIFKSQMEMFTKKIVDMLKEQNMLYWQGGPVILTQIENEYGNIDEPYGPAGKRYMHWAAKMAVGLDTEMPWVMCQQKDAPDPIINTCNGFYCDSFKPNSPKKPKMWTENWTGWFLAFGGLQPHRPVEDIAFAVARFYQRGGTFQNYYMYHGGTNFERTAGGPFIATSYDYDAPIDEYGLLRQPKWGHLKDLHQAIKLCEKAILFGEVKSIYLGPHQEGHIYKTKGNECSAFLANKHYKQDVTVRFNGQFYELPAWSVSILPDCKHVIFNTAKVNVQTSVMNMAPVDPKYVVPSYNQSSSTLVWKSYSEPIGVWGSNVFNVTGFKDQINTTKDTSDYLWYTKSIYYNSTYLKSSARPSISIKALGHNMLIFINGNLLGNGYGSYSSPSFQLQLPVKLQDGINTISLLSTTVGLQNYGSFFDTAGAGIDGPVALIDTLGSDRVDLSSQTWTYQIGLKGENLRIFSGSEALNVSWDSKQPPPTYQPMIWYKTTFNSPPGNDPVALDLVSMGKGQAWVNGKGLGRYWLSFLSSNLGCSSECDYRGVYDPTKCSSNCGQPSQKWYHIPRSWLKPTENSLVLFEELGGDPTKISFVTRAPGLVCGHISEANPTPIDDWTVTNGRRPEMSLQCGPNQKMVFIEFASYGNPEGTCQNVRKGSCHSEGSIDVVQKACLGKEQCSISVSPESFGEDPCPSVTKSLAVRATCS